MPAPKVMNVAGEQQYQNTAADRLLASLLVPFALVAHGAALAESGRHPKQQEHRIRGAVHFTPTPRCRIRYASGKKTSIMARQNTSELMVTHFMAEISNFRCMK